MSQFDSRFFDFLPTILGVKQNSVREWYFPPEFCQSKLADRSIESTACTLIALLMAEFVETSEERIRLDDEILNSNVVEALSNAILDGNQLVAREAERLNRCERDILFNIEQAMELLNSEFDEFCLFQNMNKPKTLYETLRTDLKRALSKWDMHNERIRGNDRTKWPSLYMVTIAFKCCILFIYQPRWDLLLLIDPHCHYDRGAVIAAAKSTNIDEFHEWVLTNIFDKFIYKKADCYEMALLHHC